MKSPRTRERLMGGGARLDDSYIGTMSSMRATRPLTSVMLVYPQRRRSVCGLRRSLTRGKGELALGKCGSRCAA